VSLRPTIGEGLRLDAECGAKRAVALESAIDSQRDAPLPGDVRGEIGVGEGRGPVRWLCLSTSHGFWTGRSGVGTRRDLRDV
jgi:hypothetical protein